MTKGKHGNKEAKKPKKVVVPPVEALVAPSTPATAASPRGKRR